MNKQNLGKLLGVALVVAIISTGLFYMLFAMKANSETRTTIVVAAKPLKPGSVLVAADVKAMPWSSETLPKGAYQRPEEVVGNTVFDSIGEAEPVYASHLASAKSGGGSGVPEGMRAVSVHVADSTGVFALLRSGQKVDVQVVLGRGKSDGKAETEVRTALENLSVLSVNPQPEQSSQGFPVPVVTLLAKPAEADILAAADSGATVRLVLRNPLDQSIRTRPPVSLSSLLRGAGN
ncbi:MAG: Flp pilus assembly protein CpaB [Bryobacteraceae bacterium]